MKRRYAIALLCLVLLCSFAACDLVSGGLVGELFGDGNVDIGERPIEPGGIVGPDEQFTDWWGDDTNIEIETMGPVVELPAEKYAGQTLNLLGSHSRDIGLDDPENDIVGQLSYQRNQMVEQKYGITIKIKQVSDNEIPNEIYKQISSGENGYDLVFGSIASAGAPVVQRGVVYNLYDVPWVDMNSTGWDAGIYEGLAIEGYLPMATGAVTPDATLKTAVIAYNVQLAEEQGLGSLYYYVEDHGWTLEKMHAMSEMVYTDLNGDGVANIEHDLFGLVGDVSCAQAFACGMNTQLIVKDQETNLPVINQDTGLIIQAYDLFSAMINGNGSGLKAMRQQGIYDVFVHEDTFKQGRAMFYATNVEGIMQLSDMTSVYGILPYPMADQAQSEYRSYVDCNACAVMIPANCRALDFAGYALEAMNQASVGLYENSIATRICRSPEDVGMLEWILRTQTFDFSCNYLTSTQVDKVDLFRHAIESDQVSIENLLNANQKTLGKALQKVISSVQ